MIFTLNILIDLCLIFAIAILHKRGRRYGYPEWSYKNPIHRHILDYEKRLRNETLGKLDSVTIQAKLAEKMADRAFNMASTANLGVVALQKALATPRLMNRQQSLQNQLAKDGVDKLFHQGGTFDWLRPILSEEELEILDDAQKHHDKAMSNGN